VAIYRGLAGSEMCLPHTIEQLHVTIKELALSHEQLATTQEALMQSEKLASMGQLAAGVAHEVNNPLGVVLMYTHLLLDEVEKSAPIREDLTMIAEQADRCKKIVAGLLDFARQNKVLLQTANVNELAEKSLRSIPIPEHIAVAVDHQVVDPVLSIQDTGIGIPKEHMSKIFTPFFTTKKMGKGTGLGLAVTYGIVKMHRGDIRVKSNSDPAAGPTGTTFTVTFPRQGRTE
jgi:signal transduction histidine kinase